MYVILVCVCCVFVLMAQMIGMLVCVFCVCAHLGCIVCHADVDVLCVVRIDGHMSCLCMCFVFVHIYGQRVCHVGVCVVCLCALMKHMLSFLCV